MMLYRHIHAIVKTMCPLGYHHNGFVATHAPGLMMHSYILLVPMNQRVLSKQACLVCLAYLACRILFGSFVPAMCNCTPSA